MTFTLILIALPVLVIALSVADRQGHREAGSPTLDGYAGVLTDLGPDADTIRRLVSARADRDRPALHDRSGDEGVTGFPGPRWLGVR